MQLWDFPLPHPLLGYPDIPGKTETSICIHLVIPHTPRRCIEAAMFTNTKIYQYYIRISYTCVVSIHIISGWWLTYPPWKIWKSENMKVRLDHHPNYWGKNHVPNQQPDLYTIIHRWKFQPDWFSIYHHPLYYQQYPIETYNLYICITYIINNIPFKNNLKY